MRGLVHVLDAAGEFPVPAGELSIVFLDATAMGALHARFIDDPTPTDVITFDGDPLLGAAGEICVCADVANEYAAAHGSSFATELALYVVHGYLHLAGHDDIAPAAQRAMRAAEKRALRVLAAAEAMPRFSFSRRASARPSRDH